MRFNPTCVVTPSSFYYNTVLPLGFEEHRQEDAHELQVISSAVDSFGVVCVAACYHSSVRHASAGLY